MKTKTSELSGVQLDWAVVRSNRFIPFTDGISWLIEENGVYKQIPKYSTDWAQGGPIIEREEVNLERIIDGWRATTDHTTKDFIAPTPLIAAMRCYVAVKLGDEVEIPEELQ